MSDFTEKLSALCARELVHARRDPGRMAEMIEALSNVSGLAIAIGSRGNAGLAQTLTDGFENHMAESSGGRRQNLAEFLAERDP